MSAKFKVGDLIRLRVNREIGMIVEDTAEYKDVCPSNYRKYLVRLADGLKIIEFREFELTGIGS